MNERMKIQKEVAIIVDTFSDNTKAFGKKAKNAFAEKHKSQMRNLENIANSTLKASDVLDYIKRQTGRSEKDKMWKKDNFGNELLDKLEKELKKKRDQISDKLSVTKEIDRLDIYLMLIREFIKQIVVHYEYELGESS
jgi:uncharacterized protein YaaR (DUF327 family)